jgi:putative membrane protein
MNIAANAFTLLVATFHVAILILEMFFWNHPVGHKIFAMTPEVAESSAVLAMNQGLYNGFLAAGLFWGLFASRTDVKVFFLGCVVVAGIFGGITAKPSIVLTQALPAFIALALVLLSSRKAESPSSNS